VKGACQVLRAAWPRLTACYDELPETRPGIQGSVKIVLKLALDGTVPEVSGGGGPLGALVPCLKGVAKTLKFAPPEGGRAIIVVPLTFVAQ